MFRRLAACAGLCAAALAQDVAFSADVASPGVPLSTVILDSFGSSHGSTTLRATWRTHFSTVLHDIPFRHVRFHGILDDDMSTWLRGFANGALVFDTLDFLVASGVAPLIELSFMPIDLAVDPSLTVMHYQGGISTFKNETQWRGFITQLFQLCIDRYGAAEVRKWRVEVWNEPNCGFFAPADGCGPDKGNKTGYFELYRATAEAVKAADAGIPVGGPATAQLSWIPEFLAYTAGNSVPIDFVSSHLYPTDPAVPASRDGFMEAVAAAAALAQAAGVPFLLTEFNAGLGGPDLCHNRSLLDSSYAAAFVLHHHLASQAVAGLASMSWWTFTDWGFEEQGVDPEPYRPGHSKFGAMTSGGVPKPVYRGMQLIAEQAAAASIPVQPVGAADGRRYAGAAGVVAAGATAGTIDVTVSKAGAVVTALACNFNFSAAALPAPAQVSITFTGLAGPLPTAATLELIDDAHANPMAVWEAAGSPTYPPAAEVAAELAASQLVAQPLALAAVGANAVQAVFTLQPYAVARVRFSAAAAAAA